VTDVSEELAAFIITAMMDAESSSETSVNLYETALRNLSEDTTFTLAAIRT
jgi:hypothetical protein